MSRETEYRGALAAIRDGGRAEQLESYTLEFKEPGKNPEDTLKAILDAALCFANAGGGTIVVGIANKGVGPTAFRGTNVDPTITQKRIYDLTTPGLLVDARLEEHEGVNLLIIQVTASPEIHADKQGRAIRRIATDCLPMSPQEQQLLREDRQRIDWSAAPSSRSSKDVAADALPALRALLSALPDDRNRLARLGDRDLLRALGLIDRDGRLLRAGEVLLCAPSDDEGPRLIYQYKATQGGEPTSVHRLRVPLAVAFRRVLDFIAARRELTALSLPSGQQIQIEDFPERAVREALANAVMHRDYHADTPVIVEHSPEVLVVTSPGPLVSGVTEANIITHPSKPRNPKLAAAAHQLGLAEQVGRGVDRMIREMIRSGREAPRIEGHPDRVRVTLVGGAPNANIARYVAQLPESEREDTDTMLTVFTMCPRANVTASELAGVLQKTVDEAQSVLRRLASDEVGMLEPTRESSRRRLPSYRFRGEAIQALGSAVRYRRRTTDEIDRKVIAHVREYGHVTNKTVQNLLDVSMIRAKQILQDLMARDVIVKTSEHERGPGVRYGPGNKFPIGKRRRPAAVQLSLGTARRRARRRRPST